MLRRSREEWLSKLTTVVPSETASVMLLNSAKTHLEIVASVGFLSAPNLSLPRGVGIAGAVLESGIAECIKDVHDDPRFLAAEYDMSALLAVPIRLANGEVFGVANLADPLDSDGFSAEDLQRVEAHLSETPFPAGP